jgi:hypothetical protein
MDKEEKLKKLRDPKFYLETFTKIKGKTPGLAPFILNEAQKDFLNTIRKENRAIVLKARQVGFCLDPETKVLLSDLTWVTLEEAKVGDMVVSVDEFPRGKGARKMVEAVIEAKKEVVEEAFKITFEGGESLIATGPHRFLQRKRGATDTLWRTVEDTKVGDIVRFVVKPWGEPNYEDGWFSGMLDGEGCFAKKSRTGAAITMSQVDGPVFDRMRRYVNSQGIAYRHEVDRRTPGAGSKLGSKDVQKMVIGNLADVFRVLGITRPSRIVRHDWWVGKKLPGNGDSWKRVVSIVSLGKQRMIDLQTSTKTFLAEGFVSHNSTLVSGYLYHRTITNPGMNTALIGYNSDLTTELLDKVKTFWRTTPEALRPKIQYNSKYEISFPVLDSKIIVLPSSENVGRGYTLHNCVSGDTKVFLRDGVQKKIKDILPGEEVVNGNGGFSKVLALSKKVPQNKMYRVGVVQGDPLVATEDHLVLVRGTKEESFKPQWKKVGELSSEDCTAVPYKKPRRGRTHYWLRIRDIQETVPERYVYDLSLEGEPHSFLTGSGVVHNCLLTELAFWDKPEEKMLAIENAVPASGKIIVESTPNGVGNLFYRMWMADNGYEKKAYGWWWHYTEEEVDAIRRRINDPRRFAQEYELEFLASGRSVFDQGILKRMAKDILSVGDAVKMEDGSVHFVKEIQHGLRVYKPPVEGGIYVVGADVAEGVTGGDFSVATIFDRKTGEEVAFFRGYIPPDIFGEKLNLWGRMYGDALMVVESNNHGLTTITALKKLLYPHLYFRPAKFDTISSQWGERLGWKTTKITRTLLIDDLSEAVRNEELVVHSKETISEMTTMIFDNFGNMVPQGGFHDDCVFATGIGLQGFKVLYDKPLEQISYEDYLPKNHSY